MSPIYKCSIDHAILNYINLC